MNKFILLLILLVPIAFITGCSSLNNIGGYVNDNPVIVNAAVRQAVFRYIDAGETEAEKDSRARGTIEVVRKVDAFLEGNPESNVATLLTVAEASIPFDKLSIPDQFLVRDILALVSLSLEDKENEGLIDPEALIGLRAVLHTVVSTAALL